MCIGTVGRRTAHRYARVYDKGVESQAAPVGTMWRYEIEAKKTLARALWQDFQTTRDVPRWCYSSCERQWKRLGRSWLLPSADDPGAVVVGEGRGPAPAEALERWLTATVRPTVPRYVAHYGVARLLEVLGISDQVMVKTTREVLDDME